MPCPSRQSIDGYNLRGLSVEMDGYTVVIYYLLSVHDEQHFKKVVDFFSYSLYTMHCSVQCLRAGDSAGKSKDLPHVFQRDGAEKMESLATLPVKGRGK